MKRLGHTTAGTIRDLRRKRNVTRLHRIGPRAFDELLRVIGADKSCMTQIEMRRRRGAR